MSVRLFLVYTVLMVLSASYLFLNSAEKKENSSNRVFSGIDVREITQIRFEARNMDPWLLVRKKDDYFFDKAKVKDSAIKQLLSVIEFSEPIARFRTSDAIEAKGLKPPLMTLSVRANDRGSVLEIGRADLATRGYYALSDNKLILVSNVLVETLKRRKEDYLSLEVIDAPSAKKKQVKIFIKDAHYSFVRKGKLFFLKTNNAIHKLIASDERMIQGLYRLKASRWVDAKEKQRARANVEIVADDDSYRLSIYEQCPAFAEEILVSVEDKDHRKIYFCVPKIYQRIARMNKDKIIDYFPTRLGLSELSAIVHLRNNVRETYYRDGVQWLKKANGKSIKADETLLETLMVILKRSCQPTEATNIRFDSRIDMLAERKDAERLFLRLFKGNKLYIQRAIDQMRLLCQITDEELKKLSIFFR